MVYKLLFLLGFFVPYNMAYNLEQLECPRWAPGTNEILPMDITLSPQLKLQNSMRCYCQVVKVKERECIDNRVPPNLCKQRTADWIEANLKLNINNVQDNVLMRLPKRNLILNEY
tara:strand:- start:270 stop:614 length:345 start_codon:yes stop_codon:yes gene_type:complete